jgi:group I intron endonuclease
VVEKVYGYIYIIENDFNDKLYVGQTIAPDKREYAHLNGFSDCPYLKAAIIKHGSSHFQFVLLESCNTLENLNERECFWIKELNALAPHGYNLTGGGEGMPSPSPETRIKLCKAKRGINSPWWGKKLSESHKKKLSDAKKGKKLSEAHKKKLSEASKHLSGDKHPKYGKPVSEGTSAKLSLALKGRPSHRKGKSISESHRRRIAAARMGTTHSEETKNKMSIAQKTRWARSKK